MSLLVVTRSGGGEGEAGQGRAGQCQGEDEGEGGFRVEVEPLV